MNWSEKYRPKNIDDLYLQFDIKSKIKKWISDFKNKKNNFTNCLILHGPPGIGKTSLANIILETNGFDIREFNSSDIRSQKVLKEKIEQINGNVNILNFMCNEKKHIGVIIDELDGLSSMEKGSVKLLTSIITSTKNFSSPFICTTNSINKKMDILRKKSFYIKLNKPNRNVVKQFIVKINELENLNLTSEIINLLVNKSQLDFRRVIVLMEYLFRYEKKKLDKDLIETLIENYEKKIIDYTSYEATEKFLNNYQDSVDELINLDKSNIGYLYYENFVNYIINNKTNSDKEKLDIISKIYSLFQDSDILDNRIYINQYFILNNYNDFIKFKMPNYLMNKKLKKTPYNKYNKVNYSTLINKISFEYLNLKTIKTIKDFNLSDNYIFTCDYIYLLLKEQDIKLKKIISDNNIDKILLEKICKYSTFFKKEDLKTLKKTITKYYK